MVRYHIFLGERLLKMEILDIHCRLDKFDSGKNLSQKQSKCPWAVLRNASKCSNTTCMLRFFTVSRLALNPNLIFEIGSYQIHACEFHFKNNVTECDKSFL